MHVKMRVVGRGTEIRVWCWLDLSGGDDGREKSRKYGIQAVEEEYRVEEDRRKEVGCCKGWVHVGRYVKMCLA